MQLALHVDDISTTKQKKPFSSTLWLLPEGGINVTNNYVFCGVDTAKLSEIVLGKSSAYPLSQLQKYEHLTACVAVSANGKYVGASLYTGEVVLWDRETDTLRQIPSFPDTTSKDGPTAGSIYGLNSNNLSGSTGTNGSSTGTSAPSTSSGLAEFFLTQKKKSKEDAKSWGAKHLFVSDDGQYIVFISSDKGVWLWEDPTNSYLFGGRWHLVPTVTPSSISTIRSNSKSDINSQPLNLSYWTACFFSTPVLGRCLRLTHTNHTPRSLTMVDYLVYLQSTKQDGVESTGTASFPFNIRVQSLTYPASSSPVEGEKILIPKWDPQGTMLAVVLNSSNYTDTTLMLYTSLFSKSAIQQLGREQHGTTGKHPNTLSWIADLNWTCDSLFIVIINKAGSVMLLTRLGNIVTTIVQDRGCFDYAFPLFEGASAEGAVFSISCHPTHHYAVASDGYNHIPLRLKLIEQSEENLDSQGKVNLTLSYPHVVEALVFGHLPGIPFSPDSAWRLALTCPIFDAKISSLLFYIADNFASIFLSSQDTSMKIMAVYSEMLEWLEWDEAHNYPLQLSLQFTISTLQFLLGNNSDMPTPLMLSHDTGSTHLQQQLQQQLQYQLQHYPQQHDQQRFYVAVHVIRLCENHISKRRSRGGINTRESFMMVQQWRQLAEAAVDPTCLYSTSASTSLMTAIGKFAALQCMTVPITPTATKLKGKGKTPEPIKEGHVLLLEGSLEQAIAAYQKAGSTGVLPWMLLLISHQDFSSAIQLSEAQISNIEVDLTQLVSFDLIENLFNFQSPILLPAIRGNKWSIISLANFITDFLVKTQGKEAENPKATVPAFSPIDYEEFTELLETSDTYSQIVSSTRLRQLGLSIQSVATNLEGIEKYAESDADNLVSSETPVSSATFEFLATLALRLYLLADKPLLAVMLCEALGCWHIALLVAKIWNSELAHGVIQKQFDEYFARTNDGSNSLDENIAGGNNTSSQSSAFSIEDLVVAANILDYLHENLILQVLEHELSKLNQQVASASILTASVAENGRHLLSFFDVAASISTINTFSLLSDNMSEGLRQEKIYRTSVYHTIRGILFVLVPYMDSCLELLRVADTTHVHFAIFQQFRVLCRIMWYMEVRDHLASVLESGGGDKQSALTNLEWAIHILPFYDIHNPKSVQEAFFRVANAINLSEYDDQVPVFSRESEEAHRLASLIVHFLPSEQICAPLLAQYSAFKEKYATLYEIIDELDRTDNVHTATPLTAPQQACWLYESEPIFNDYLLEEVYAKAKKMRFRSDIHTYAHPSQSWRALVTWVEDASAKMKNVFSRVPIKIILESSLHRFVPEVVLKQLVTEQRINAAQGEQTVPTKISQQAFPERAAKPTRSSSAGAIPKANTVLKPGPVAKGNPSVHSQVPSVSLAQIHDSSLPPHHPNRGMVKSASSPRPSRRLRSNSKEKEPDTAELFHTSRSELRYSRAPKRNALIREASIENITPVVASHSPRITRNVDSPVNRPSVDLNGDYKGENARNNSPERHKRAHTPPKKEILIAEQAQPDSPRLSSSTGARMQGNHNLEFASTDLAWFGSEFDGPPATPTITVRSPTEYDRFTAQSSGEDVRNSLNHPTSFHSTSTALHYSSSDESPRGRDTSRKVHGDDSSRPPTPLMLDNSDAYFIRDYEEEIVSDWSPSGTSPLPQSSLPRSPLRSSKPDKKSHRRTQSDSPHVSELQPDKKSKRRSVMGSFLSFLKHDDDRTRSAKNLPAPQPITGQKEVRKKHDKSKRRSMQLPADYDFDSLVQANKQLEEKITKRSMSPALRMERDRQLGRPSSPLQTDYHSYQLVEPADLKQPNEAQPRRKLRRNRLSVSEADLFSRASHAQFVAAAEETRDNPYGFSSDDSGVSPRNSWSSQQPYEEPHDFSQQKRHGTANIKSLTKYSSRDSDRDHRHSHKDYTRDSHKDYSDYRSSRTESFKDSRKDLHRDLHKESHNDSYGDPLRNVHSEYFNPQHGYHDYNRDRSYPDTHQQSRYPPTTSPPIRLLRTDEIFSNQADTSYNTRDPRDRDYRDFHPQPNQHQPTPRRTNHNYDRQVSQPHHKLSASSNTAKAYPHVTPPQSAFIKPLTAASTSVDNVIVDRVTIANNIKMLRSSSMPETQPTQQRSKQLEPKLLGASSTTRPHPPVPHEQVRFKPPGVTALLLPTSLPGATDRVPQGYEYSDGAVKSKPASKPKSPSFKASSITTPSFPTNRDNQEYQEQSHQQVHSSNAINVALSNSSADQRKSFVQLLSLNQIPTPATSSTKLLLFHKKQEPDQYSRAAALHAQEEEYENMKKLLLLKKFQEELNSSNLISEMKAGESAKPSNLVQDLQSATDEESKIGTTGLTENDGRKREIEQEVGLPRQGRKGSIVRRRATSVTTNDNPSTSSHRDSPTYTRREEPQHISQPSLEDRKSDTMAHSNRTQMDPNVVFGEMPSSKFYDKLNPVHMSTDDIDRELKELEALREESRTTMSDFLANQLRRISETRSQIGSTNTHSRPLGGDIALTTDSSLPMTIKLPELHKFGSDSQGIVQASLQSFQIPKGFTKNIPEVVLDGTEYHDKAIKNMNSFLDVVDLDKNTFGDGPIIGAERRHSNPIQPFAPDNRATNSPVIESRVPKRPTGAMHARLEALADQLDQIEQSAQALQHDLAYSVKVVNNINDKDIADPPTVVYRANSPKVSRSLPTTPTANSTPQSPRFPLPTSPKHGNMRGTTQFINQHTQQRIQDAMELIGDGTKRRSADLSARNSPPAARKPHSSPPVSRKSPNVARKSGNWQLTTGNNDKLSETQIQKLLSLASSQQLTESATLDKPVDWEELEKILKE